MADLNSILQRSKAVMARTKDLPYGGYVDKAGGTVNAEGEIMFESRTSNSPTFSESAASKSKLPQEVINAMRASSNEPISIIDSVGISETLKENINKQQNKQLKETRQATTTNSQTIDYPLIRMMIEETMKKYMGQLKKSLINEDKGGGLQLMTQKGNTFRFVTEDGKIFEGKLTYKGNIND